MNPIAVADPIMVIKLVLFFEARLLNKISVISPSEIVKALL